MIACKGINCVIATMRWLLANFPSLRLRDFTARLPQYAELFFRFDAKQHRLIVIFRHSSVLAIEGLLELVDSCFDVCPLLLKSLAKQAHVQ